MSNRMLIIVQVDRHTGRLLDACMHAHKERARAKSLIGLLPILLQAELRSALV